METENKKAVYISLAIACLITGYLLNRGLSYLATTTGVRNIMLGGVLELSVVISALAAIGMFVGMTKSAAAMGFLVEVLGEFKKIVWPTRKETTLSTMVVIVLVFITAVMLWFFDWVWSALIRSLVS